MDDIGIRMDGASQAALDRPGVHRRRRDATDVRQYLPGASRRALLGLAASAIVGRTHPRPQWLLVRNGARFYRPSRLALDRFRRERIDRPLSAKFRVGLTRDLLTAAGDPSFGSAPLDLLNHIPGIEWEYLPAKADAISAIDTARYDALYVAPSRVPAAAVDTPDLRVKLIARHGVGFDAVDLPAM